MNTALAKSILALLEIVEGCRAERWAGRNGLRLVDTPEWCEFYCATRPIRVEKVATPTENICTACGQAIELVNGVWEHARTPARPHPAVPHFHRDREAVGPLPFQCNQCSAMFPTVEAGLLHKLNAHP